MSNVYKNLNKQYSRMTLSWNASKYEHKKSLEHYRSNEIKHFRRFDDKLNSCLVLYFGVSRENHIVSFLNWAFEEFLLSLFG